MTDTTKAVDFEVSNGGTIFLIRPLTAAAREWVSENLTLESWQWFGGGFAVEHRYVVDIVAGIREAGLEVR